MLTRHNVVPVGLGKTSDAHMVGWKDVQDRVKILVDTDGARPESNAEEYHVPEFGTEFQELLDRSDIDIVDLVLPHFLHAPYSIAALKAGKHAPIP
jgi:predicted dehydrogenase